jgi:hypothetical protein
MVMYSPWQATEKTAICCVSEKIQTAYLLNTPRGLDFFASLHLTIFSAPANFDFFEQTARDRLRVPIHVRVRL